MAALKTRVTAACVLALCGLCSCAHAPSGAGNAAAPRWPAASPRLVWAGQVATEKDIDGGGFWGNIWERISGSEPERIGRPYGVHVDRLKRILVADSQRHGLHVFDRSEKRYHFIGPGQGADFTLPIAVAEDDAGRAYVTDAVAGKVFRLDLRLQSAEAFLSGLARPTGIAFNKVNRLLYLSDTLAGQVVAFDLSGREALRFGRPGAGRGELNRPTDLTVDVKGNVFVTDAMNTRIQIFSPSGAFLSMFGEPGDSTGYLGKPKGVAVNGKGEIFVCDALTDTVQVFDRQGRSLYAFGSTGSGAGNFWMPSGIAVDGDDNVYVVDTYNSRIQMFSRIGRGER